MPTNRYVFLILLGFAAVQVGIIIVTNVLSYLSQIQSDIVSDHMSEMVINKAIETDMEYFDSDMYHDVYERAVAQSSGRPIMVLNSLSQLVQSLISLFAIFLLLLTLHWAVSIVLALIALPIALIRLYYTNKLVKLKVKQTQQDRRTNYFRRVLTATEYVKEVRIFGFGPYLLNQFLSIKEKLRIERAKLYFGQSKSLVFAQSVEAVSIVFALGIMSMRALKGLISVGDIAMYFGAFQKGQTNINTALKSMVSLHENRKYLEHLFEFLDLEKKIVDPFQPLSINGKIEQMDFNNVSFTYPKTNKKILNNITFSARRGELVAIVGQNGSGKSTIVKLLNRLYEPDEGEITLNGINVSDLSQKDLRKKLTVIFQHYSKYNITVKENIHFANVFQPASLKRIEESSEKAMATQVIKKLKYGFDTPLGRHFQQGEELSGGEWQKIALSRAFYKDADIIILDEPTSFIDPIDEDEIFSNLREIAKDKIMILITHRIYNLKHADQIIVLKNGNITEKGNHVELMKSAGLYKDMFERQD